MFCINIFYWGERDGERGARKRREKEEGVGEAREGEGGRERAGGDNIVFFPLPVIRALGAISISRSASFLRERTNSNTHTHTLVRKSLPKAQCGDLFMADKLWFWFLICICAVVHVYSHPIICSCAFASQFNDDGVIRVMENIKRHAAELNPTNVSGGNFGAAQTAGAGGGPGDPGGRRQDGVNKAKLEVSLCI